MAKETARATLEAIAMIFITNADIPILTSLSAINSFSKKCLFVKATFVLRIKGSFFVSCFFYDSYLFM
jgi:hypothetical protein